MKWTIFNGVKDQGKTDREGDWDDVVDEVTNAPKADSKTSLPLLKLAEFGDTRNKKGTLRCEENIRKYYGAEGDYDAEQMSIQEAYDRLMGAGVKCVLYTTSSHTPEKPRWRIFAPFSEPHDAETRTVTLNRINGVLGGVLAGESWTPAQSYFIGTLRGQPDAVVMRTDSDCGYVDAMFWLDDTAIGKDKAPNMRLVSDKAQPFAIPDTTNGKLTEGTGRRELLKSLGGKLRYDGLNADEIFEAFKEFAVEHFADDNIDWANIRELATWCGSRSTREDVVVGEFRDVEDTQVSGKQHPLARFREAPGAVIPDDGFVINGIISDKLSFIGAYAGAGKTTAIAPLMMIAAGLIVVKGMEIYAWRRVVFISEHPEQIEATLRALADHYFVGYEEMHDRIKIVEARRMTAASVVKVAPDYTQLAATHTQNGVTVDFMPWVIFDTQSATFSLENENDNAEAGKMVATVKQNMNMPVTVVAHTAKVARHGDVASMTVRGGGAFEGDANQIIYLSNCKETGQRFFEIAIPKHRFTASCDAIAISYNTTEFQRLDPFGRLVTRTVGFCTVEPVTADERKEAKTQAENQEKARDIALSREGIVRYLKSVQVSGTTDPDAYPSQNGLVDMMKDEFGRNNVIRAIKAMQHEGFLVETDIPDGINLRGGRETYLRYKPAKFTSV